MIGRIIGMVCCFLCAFPLFIISHYNRDSREPIVFWAGDEKKIKAGIKNVKDYNYEMSRLYVKCSLAFVIVGILCLIHPAIGLIGIVFNCTIGVYMVWRLYKEILSRYESGCE
ncbi:MAG: hypothetical protein J6D08_10915 [Lachnospiraceae bacterium]|nr:hypothetical protein [Lachnospiraceae bacterium]